MLKIGLTGGIGSGKTTVARIFELLGIPVYYADEAARLIMKEDKLLRKAIVDHFGEDSYIGEELNRVYLAKKVFNDAYQLEVLNALVHPATLRHAAQWMGEQKSPYAIKEAALIFESGSAAQLDYVIGVSAPVELRIKRTIARNNLTALEVNKRIENQVDESIKMKLCDFVLTNNESQLLIPQVLSLHEKLLQLPMAKV